MENKINEAKFEISSGAKVTITAELVLSKVHYCDGDNVTVDCCEMGLVKADIEGHPQQVGFLRFPKPVDHEAGPIFGSIGKLGLTKDNIAKVEAVISKLEQHPLWIAKQAQIKKNQKEIAELEAARDRDGYCQKCGTYCCGDCEAS